MKVLVCFSAVLLTMAAGRPAFAGVITFESLAHPESGNTALSSPYIDSSFEFLMLASAPFNTFWVPGTTGPEYSGSTGLASGYYYGSIEIERVDSTPFTLTSIDVGEFNPGDNLASVTITGTLSAGGTVTQTLSVNPTQTFETNTLTGFSSVTSVTLFGNAAPSGEVWFQIDNVAFSDAASAPEPASYLLLLGGVAILALMRRHAPTPGVPIIRSTAG